MKTTIITFAVLLCLVAVSPSFGTNLANPAAPVSDARLSVGMSYFVGGSTITDDSLPMMANRFGVRVSYAPVRYVNFGLDFGTSQISVERYMRGGDTVPVFNSEVGWSVGGHLKAATPLFFDYVSLFGIANGNLFHAENKYGAYYAGKEGVGVVGAQVRVPGFGYISVGPQVYLIMGENRAHDDHTDRKVRRYSNLNNIRGWISVDYFPDMGELMGANMPYVSLEFTMSPKINSSSRVPVQEFSIALSIGVITQRLYGEDREPVEF